MEYIFLILKRNFKLFLIVVTILLLRLSVTKNLELSAAILIGAILNLYYFAATVISLEATINSNSARIKKNVAFGLIFKFGLFFAILSIIIQISRDLFFETILSFFAFYVMTILILIRSETK